MIKRTIYHRGLLLGEPSDTSSTRVGKRLVTKIDSYQAAHIARKFFEQYNSGVEIKDLELKNGIWFVTVGVDFLFERIKKIEIDAYTGKIIQYHQ